MIKSKFSERFIDLVSSAKKQSDKFYSDQIHHGKPNPFYIGFGNPNSGVLIIGQEKAIKADKLMQVKAESLENPKHWKYLVENEITDIDYKFYSDFHFKNPLHPYDGKPTKGNTWLHYQKLVDLMYPNLITDKWNSFLLNSFITEINHQVSPRQLGNQKDENREVIISHRFYKSFNVTILACGSYLKPKEIEAIFNVKETANLSKPRQRLLVFSNQDRILISTRQLSMDVKHEYLELIAKTVKAHHEK